MTQDAGLEGGLGGLSMVVFILADEGQKDCVERLGEKLRRKGIRFVLLMKADWTGERTDGDTVERNTVHGDATGRDTFGRDAVRADTAGGRQSLFITDDAALLKELKAAGESAIAFLHENNRQEDLSAAVYAVTDLVNIETDYLERTWRRLRGLPVTVARTGRCVIREMTVEDVDAFYEIYKEPFITAYMDGLYADPEREREYTRAYIREIYGFYGYGLWSVVQRDSGRIIGRAGLSHREGFEDPELGFVIAVPFQKQGYGYEVCEAILRYGQKTLGFRRVQALILDGNAASVRLCERLGFHYQDRVESRGKHYDRYFLILSTLPFY